MFSHRIDWNTDGTVDITIYPNEGDLVKKIGVRSNNLGELMNDLIPSHLADDLRAKLSMRMTVSCGLTLQGRRCGLSPSHDGALVFSFQRQTDLNF